MERSECEEPRIANNRLAAAVVIGSAFALVAFAVLAAIGPSSRLLPRRLPAIELLPLYVIGVLFLGVLVAWSWGRVLSFF